MPDLVLKDVARQNDGLNAFLKKEFGITGRQVGANIALTSTDAAKAFGGQRFLVLHRQLALDRGKEGEVASALYALMSPEVKQLKLPPPPAVSMHGGYGLLTEVARATTQLAIQTESYVEKDFGQIVIPLLRDKLQAKFVTGVTVDAGRLQAHISFAKISLLVGLFDVQQAQQKVQAGDALSGALPSAFDPLSYVDALTRFSPLALTLPVRRGNCAWHFQGEAMWGFQHEVVSGLFAEFASPLNPMASNSHVLGLHGLKDMNEANIWRFLKLVVDGVNKLLAHVVDGRNFADQVSGELDLLRQVQTHSAIHLLFADLGALNHSTSAHHRIGVAMSALDKLANLRAVLGGAGGRESDAFRALCSESQRDELIRVFTKQCDAHGYDTLKVALRDTVTRCFDDLQTHLAAQGGGGASSEAARLDRLWSQRNIRHGAFLQRRQFETLFLNSHGHVPATIASIPFLMVLGLAFDPASFLAFRPIVAS